MGHEFVDVPLSRQLIRRILGVRIYGLRDSSNVLAMDTQSSPCGVTFVCPAKLVIYHHLRSRICRCEEVIVLLDAAVIHILAPHHYPSA